MDVILLEEWRKRPKGLVIHVLPELGKQLIKDKIAKEYVFATGNPSVKKSAKSQEE